MTHTATAHTHTHTHTHTPAVYGENDAYDGPEGNIVDMLFMLRSAYFIGNPASSMAGNVATARAIDGHGSNFGDAEAWFHIFQVHQAPVFHSNKLEVAEKYILHARDE